MPENPSLPSGLSIRQALPSDANAIHALLRPYVLQRLLLERSEAELIEMTRHGFVAEMTDSETLIGFCAVEVYNAKLAELQCLAVRSDYHGSGVGSHLVLACSQRAKELGVMEILAISSSEQFFHRCGFDYALPDQKKAFFLQLRPRHPE